MKKTPPLSHRPFKRAHIYTSLEDAKRGLTGSPESIERIAKARMDAQELAERVRKEKEY